MNSPKFKFDKNVKKNLYLADYFLKTKKIITKNNPHQIITMQFFQRKENIILCGIEQVLQLLQHILEVDQYENLEIWSLQDGDLIQPLEPVLKIKGRYQDFGFLEGMIDGILARNSSVATNSYRVVQAANGKGVLNMNDRADLYINQPYDGYASYIGGITKFVSLAAIEYIDDEKVTKPQGTMPHALIQSFQGDVLKAAQAYQRSFPDNKLIVLVDYNNDVINDSLLIAKHFGSDLFGVRLDTSPNLTDKYLLAHRKEYENDEEINGVSSRLVVELRKQLDINGFANVKIIVSSGFDVEKISRFEQQNIPVDTYGIGSALTKIITEFTGDAVQVNGVDQAKHGRTNLISTRLRKR